MKMVDCTTSFDDCGGAGDSYHSPGRPITSDHSPGLNSEPAVLKDSFQMDSSREFET